VKEYVMDRTRRQLGDTLEGMRSDWIGDGSIRNIISTSRVRFTDYCGEQTAPVIGPQFSTLHQFYDGNGLGINAFFPETTTGRAVEFINWLPGDMVLSAPIPLYTDAPHLVVLNPQDLAGYDYQSMGRDLANSFATALAAKTNPGRPEVSLPSFIGEEFQDLKHLPDHLFQTGRKLLSHKDGKVPHSDLDAAGVYFGILPLVSDISKMFHFTELADKRAIELSNLAKKGGARVKKTLFRGSEKLILSGPDIQDIDFMNYFPDATISIHTECKIWGVLHWLPGDDAFNFVNEQGQVNRPYVKGLLNGTSAYKDKVGYLRDVWELIPWSWAADWCGDFGSFIESYSNSNIATFRDIYIMMEMSTRRTLTCSHGSCSISTVSRERHTGEPSFSLRVPFLDARKLSILAAIATKNGFRFGAHRSSGGGGPLT
jgi:hypothetical protein